MSKITALHKETEAGEVRQAPAIGMSVVMNMPGDRQATLQCFVAQEDGEVAANDLLDRMFRIADRQRARYELSDFEQELEKHRRMLANFTEDFARIEKDFALKKVEREEEAAALVEEADSIRAADYERHTKTGREGETYKPQGHVKQNIDTKKAAAAQIKIGLEKLEAERIVAMDGIRNSQERFRTEISRLEKEVAKRHELLGIGDGA